MKYGKINLGQIEAIINKLGGYDEAKRFLNGEVTISVVEKAPKMLRKSIYLGFSNKEKDWKSDSPNQGLHHNKFWVKMKHDPYGDFFHSLVDDSFEELQNADFLDLKNRKRKTTRESDKHLWYQHFLITKEYVTPTRIAQEIVFLRRSNIYLDKDELVWRFRNGEVDYIAIYNHKEAEFHYNTAKIVQTFVRTGWVTIDDPSITIFREDFFE